MTTIVYSAGTVAWDSRITAGSDIVTDTAQKRYQHGGRTFWCCGVVGDFELFCASYEQRYAPRELGVQALVLDNGRLYEAGCEDQEIWSAPCEEARAIGSGGDHAITAIDCGCTPAQAIRLAAKRDTSTGGRIRTQKLRLS